MFTKERRGGPGRGNLIKQGKEEKKMAIPERKGFGGGVRED